MPLFRFPAITLIGLFLATGPTPFQQAHVAAVDRAWARQQAAFPKPDSKIPLKHQSSRPPYHDPSTCNICIQLHAPMMAYSVWSISLQPTTRLGYLRIDRPIDFSILHPAAQNCRGPPSV